MKNTRALLLSANIAISAAGAGAIGYGIYLEHSGDRAQEARVRQLVERFQGCPERFNADRECFRPEERTQMLLSAERAEREGRFEEAGRTYASLIRSLENDPMEAKAREMVGRCPAETGRGIIQEITSRQEAIRRATQTISPNASARPAQVPIDAGAPPVDSAQPQAIETPDAGAPDAAQAPRRVTITFRTQPAGVEIFSGDQSECTANPECSVSVELGNWGLEYRFTKAGYASQTRSITPDQDRTVEVTLQRQGGGSVSRPHRTPRRTEEQPRQPVEPQRPPQPNQTVIRSAD